MNRDEADKMCGWGGCTRTKGHPADDRESEGSHADEWPPEWSTGLEETRDAYDAYNACRADAAAEFPYVDNEGWPPEFEARVVELLRDRRVPVSCDDDCGALEEPTSPEETRDAWVHWRNHSVNNGCSHGC